MKNKVAIVIPHFGNGGAEHMTSQLICALNQEAFAIKVFCIFGDYQGNALENRIKEAGIDIVYLKKGVGFSPKAVLNMWKQLRAFKPDVVHTHLSACVYCAPWVLFHKAKMVHTIHNIPQKEGNKVRRTLMRFMYKIKKAVPVAISDTNHDLVCAEYHLKPEAVQTIYNPVQCEKFYRSDTHGETVELITVGRLSAQKNQKLLIDAFGTVAQKREDVRLTIVGTGELEQQLKAQAQTLGLAAKIRFTGVVENPQDYLATADIFVLSSNYEGLPLAVLEAMAAGLPIVSTDVGGVKDIVTDNGILVPPGDQNALAKALSQLIEDSALRERLGTKSLEYAQNYALPTIARKYMELYQKI